MLVASLPAKRNLKASGQSQSRGQKMTPSSTLIELIAGHLSGELGAHPPAAAIAQMFGEDILSWRPPEVPPAQIATILGFTFGNRMQPNGNREPGPVNEALADIVVRLHRETGASVYAQWEVAEAVGDRLPQEKLVAIYPERDERAEPQYRSTAGVVDEIARRTGDPEALGTVGIVAFADHAWRCVATARRRGFAAMMPAGYPMPAEYDPLSGQPWCRSRLAYLFHDIAIRAVERRDALIRQG
jgi:hypothetical protein